MDSVLDSVLDCLCHGFAEAYMQCRIVTALSDIGSARILSITNYKEFVCDIEFWRSSWKVVSKHAIKPSTDEVAKLVTYC